MAQQTVEQLYNEILNYQSDSNDRNDSNVLSQKISKFGYISKFPKSIRNLNETKENQLKDANNNIISLKLIQAINNTFKNNVFRTFQGNKTIDETIKSKYQTLFQLIAKDEEILTNLINEQY